MTRSGRTITAGGTLAALLAALLAGGCSGTDVSVNAPILEAVGLNFTGKKGDEPDLPDRPGIVVPPTTNLPQPGEREKTAKQAWPVDKDASKKSDKQAAADKQQKYCDEGDWSGKGNIEEYNKNTGAQERCRPQWLKDTVKRRGEEGAEDVETKQN
jgi:hypothetical protein